MRRLLRSLVRVHCCSNSLLSGISPRAHLMHRARPPCLVQCRHCRSHLVTLHRSLLKKGRPLPLHLLLLRRVRIHVQILHPPATNRFRKCSLGLPHPRSSPLRLMRNMLELPLQFGLTVVMFLMLRFWSISTRGIVASWVSALSCHELGSCLP